MSVIVVLIGLGYVMWLALCLGEIGSAREEVVLWNMEEGPCGITLSIA